MERRDFFQTAFMGIMGLSNLTSLKEYLKNSSSKNQRESLPRRELGRTGEKLSIIGLGGATISDVGQRKTDQIVHSALEQGINYFDFAPSYGNAEELLGPILKPYRKDVFLSCKTLSRDRKRAEKELHQSLRKLQTDYFDLYQLHLLRKQKEVDLAFGPGGTMETIIKAKKEGKIRFAGFSAHSQEVALNCMERFDFDAIMFPINYACFFKSNFGPKVLDKAREQKMGVIAIKATARQILPSDELKKKWPKLSYQPILDTLEADLALRFALFQPVTTAIPPADLGLFERDLEIALGSIPLTEKEEKCLRVLAKGLKPLFESLP